MSIVTSIGQALAMAFSMFWDILWPLILGFTLSGIVQAVVSHQAMAIALGGDKLKNLTLATLFGIASSSCSYAAVALARPLYRERGGEYAQNDEYVKKYTLKGDRKTDDETAMEVRRLVGALPYAPGCMWKHREHRKHRKYRRNNQCVRVPDRECQSYGI